MFLQHLKLSRILRVKHLAGRKDWGSEGRAEERPQGGLGPEGQEQDQRHAQRLGTHSGYISDIRPPFNWIRGNKVSVHFKMIIPESEHLCYLCNNSEVNRGFKIKFAKIYKTCLELLIHGAINTEWSITIAFFPKNFQHYATSEQLLFVWS